MKQRISIDSRPICEISQKCDRTERDNDLQIKKKACFTIFGKAQDDTREFDIVYLVRSSAGREANVSDF